MLRERSIREAWVKLVVEDPSHQELKEDGTIHYIRAIDQFGGRHLRVLLNPDVRPQRVITAFFDRRIGRRQ